MWSLQRLLLLVTAATSPLPTVNAQNTTCSINGQTYARGQSLGSVFETRCGPWEDFPCFCDPDAYNQVVCPYCGFATTTTDHIRCAKDQQSVKFISLESNIGQRCTCDASDPSDPKGNCVDDSSAEQCEITMDDGSVITRQMGEDIGLKSRCGTTNDYPCRCNPNLWGQIDCPYCAFATADDSLICLADTERRAFLDLNDQQRTCTCEPGRSLNFPMSSDCVDIARPPIEPNAQCVFTDANGGEIFFDNGESLGDFHTHECGPPSDWPCFCNVQLPNQIECPYCSVPLAEGGFLCGADKDVLQVPQDDGIDFACLCQISDDGLREPGLVCGNFPTAAPGCSVDLVNGQKDTYAAGASIRGKEGACGQAARFPFICNPSLNTDDNLEYPYCQLETKNDGTACARDGSSVTFTNPDGQRQRCSCIYITADLGGQTTCNDVKTPEPTSSPTPNPPPVVRSTSGASTRWQFAGSFLLGAVVFRCTM